MIDETLAELARVLEDERQAIRRLDGREVVALAHRKQVLVESLRLVKVDFSPANVRRFKELTPLIRQNGVLLAHARNVLRDASAIVRGRISPVSLPVPSVRPGGRLSVRG